MLEEISKYFSGYSNIIEIDFIPFAYVRRVKSDVYKKRKVVENYYANKNALKLLLNKINYTQSNFLKIAFLLPIPYSFSKKKRKELHLSLHNKKPDLDNLIKAFLDTATEQDNFVNHIQAVKLYSLEPKIILFV